MSNLLHNSIETPLSDQLPILVHIRSRVWIMVLNSSTALTDPIYTPILPPQTRYLPLLPPSHSNQVLTFALTLSPQAANQVYYKVPGSQFGVTE